MTAENRAYAAALITFVDRDTGRTIQQYSYPITRIELRGFKADLQRVFVVDENGDWIEEARP